MEEIFVEYPVNRKLVTNLLENSIYNLEFFVYLFVRK